MWLSGDFWVNRSAALRVADLANKSACLEHCGWNMTSLVLGAAWLTCISQGTPSNSNTKFSQIDFLNVKARFISYTLEGRVFFSVHVRLDPQSPALSCGRNLLVLPAQSPSDAKWPFQNSAKLTVTCAWAEPWQRTQLCPRPTAAHLLSNGLFSVPDVAPDQWARAPYSTQHNRFCNVSLTSNFSGLALKNLLLLNTKLK